MEFVRNVFMKEDRRTLYFEDDFDFKLILHERDFIPGVTIHANIVDAIKHSRRMIMILSKWVLISCNLLLVYRNGVHFVFNFQ